MKNILSYSVFIQVLFIVPANPTGVTLQECQQLAMENYPNFKNHKLYQEIFDLNTATIQTNWLPQLSINGQALYQSDVFKLPFTPPGMETIKLPHERYQASLDVNQPIYDGGVIRTKKMLEKGQLSIHVHDIETELHQLKTTVNETFFAILLMQKADGILKSTLDLLQEKEKTLKSAIKMGIAAFSDLLRMETEILKVRQQAIENEENLKNAVQVLEILIGKDIDENILVEPEPIAIPDEMLPDRPETKSLSARQEMLQVQQQLVNSNLRPRFSIFASMGVGYPNPFNFYNVDLSPYYVLGAKANWKIWDWRASDKEMQGLKIQAEIIENNKATINRNISLQLWGLRSENEKLQKMIVHDQEMVSAMEKMRNLSSLRLDEGIISSSDYLDDVNAEKVARLNLEINRIKAIKAGINYMVQIGKAYK